MLGHIIYVSEVGFKRSRWRSSHVFVSPWMLVDYESFWACVIIVKDLSKDLTTLLNFWHSWWKLTKNTYGVKQKKKGHSRVKGLVHFIFYFILICMETTLLVTHWSKYFGVGSCVHTIELLQLKIHHNIC
jgi:hypothetical protein